LIGLALRAPASGGGMPWRWRLSSWLATAVGVVVLASVILHWGWRWLAPAPPPPVVPAAADRPSVGILAAPIFGRAEAPAPVAGGKRLAAATPTDVRVLGVFAEKDGAGYALFRLPDRGAVLVKKGQDIGEGITLVEVHPGSVRIRDHGETRDLDLRTRTAMAAPRADAPPAVAGARGACAGPAGYKGPVYRLNAELLTGIASRPESWSAVLVPVAGGVAVRDASGFATMLGMKTGDRMSQANGIALAGIEDVLVAFVNPLLASQPVHVSGTRDGKPGEWLFLNAGACPG
jgi:hypothetical protein